MLIWAVPRLLVGIRMENIQHNIHWNPVELSVELKQHTLIKRTNYWKASEHHRKLWRYDACNSKMYDCFRFETSQNKN